jgi:hypothetical protein
MTTLFISDLHLDGTRPRITKLFFEFLAGKAREAEALYILGDLFETWIGDDDDDPHQQAVVARLQDIAGVVPTAVLLFDMARGRCMSRATATATPAATSAANRISISGVSSVRRSRAGLID